MLKKNEKKVLVKWLEESTPDKKCFADVGDEVFITLREAEAWTNFGLCEVIDKRYNVNEEIFSWGKITNIIRKC